MPIGGCHGDGVSSSVGNLAEFEADAKRRIGYHASVARWWNKPIPPGRIFDMRFYLDIAAPALAGLIGAAVLKVAFVWFVVIFICSVLAAPLIRVIRKDSDLYLRDWRDRK